MLSIRPATRADADAVWSFLEPVVRAGEVYTLPRDMTQGEAMDYWFASAHEPFVAAWGGVVVGSYYIRPNQSGGGSHVANCGYLTSEAAQGRGVARAMLQHSLDHARRRGYRAMQFNFVISTNERAVQTWRSNGFDIVGTLPGAFNHPRLGYVDVYVMYKTL